MALQWINRKFWRGRRVFLTGHTGFKGGWLSLWLRELGAEVVGFANPPAMPRGICLQAGVLETMKSVIGDVRDLEALTAAMRSAEPSVVIHLAAQPLVREAYSDPISTLSTNVMGTANVCEAMRRVNRTEPLVRALLVITSDKCYENREWHWSYRENEPLGGYDLYSASKACAEHVLAAYRSSFGREQELPVAMATARAGNVIGGGDWAADRLVPDTVRALEADQPVLLRSPNAVRPWQHVLEPLSGYLLLAERLVERGAEFSEAWNFGPDPSAEVSVAELVRVLTNRWGDGATWHGDNSRSHPHEAIYLKLDSSKARARLAWQPCLTLNEAVDLTVTWYRKVRNASVSTAREITLSQIRYYSDRFVAA